MFKPLFKYKTTSRLLSKKHLVLYLVLILMFAISGCKSETNKDPSENPNGGTSGTAVGKIADYYPFNKDTVIHYKGEGNEFAEKDVSVDFIRGNRIQIRTNNGGTVAIDVLENSNGELKRLYTQAEFYYRVDMTGTDGTKTDILLKEPLVKGTSWTLSDGSERSITAVNKEIETPLGIYSAIEVTTKTGSDEMHDYYAKDIGLVKSEFVSSGLTVTSSLEKLENDIAATQMMKFYYPYFEKDKVAYLEKNVSLRTNEEILPVFEKYMKEKPNADLSADMSKNAKINKITMDPVKNLLSVDFSKELVSGMNAGSGFEGMILQSITNTLGDYYGVDKVYITLDGAPYSSGHYAMGKGETFSVDYDDVVRYE